MFALDINSVLMETWIFYTAVLIMKTILMIPLTGWSRIYYQVGIYLYVYAYKTICV
nr:unnamed protein product [Callosobruchus chinensis]